MKSQPPNAVYFLLVDDLEENLLALDALLRREGLILLKARSGREALELLLKHDVALAIVDIQMPGMDGFELAELMRGTERTCRVPIIFLTAGNADRQRKFRGYEAGAVDFLQKPLDTDILRSKADVFFELYRQRQEVALQRDELRAKTEENARLLKESQLQAEALKEADQRKDEFLALLAHELRNPLAPIRNSLQIMRLTNNAADVVEQVCSVMERQLAHMVRLVDDLLDVSRISRGKIELRKEPIELAEVVRGAVETCEPIVRENDHQLTVSLPSEPIQIDADQTRLTQALCNLLSNAARYTENAGQINLSLERQGNEAVISVRDNGIGIPAPMLSRIFEIFTQVDRTLEKSQGGLGIGLTIVKRLVEMHGGTIEARSAGLGQGSEFVVHLPLSPAAADSDAAVPAVAH